MLIKQLFIFSAYVSRSDSKLNKRYPNAVLINILVVQLTNILEAKNAPFINLRKIHSRGKITKQKRKHPFK